TIARGRPAWTPRPCAGSWWTRRCRPACGTDRGSAVRILSDALTFDAWRDQARALLGQGAAPETVSWEAPDRPSLFGLSPPPAPVEGPAPRVPAALVAALRQAAPYRVAGRWNLLYRVLWRGVHGERQAHLPGDQDGSA